MSIVEYVSSLNGLNRLKFGGLGLQQRENSGRRLTPIAYAYALLADHVNGLRWTKDSAKTRYELIILIQVYMIRLRHKAHMVAPSSV
jgi:hypothetical protein